MKALPRRFISQISRRGVTCDQIDWSHCDEVNGGVERMAESTLCGSSSGTLKLEGTRPPRPVSLESTELCHAAIRFDRRRGPGPY
jgi:hypothetical protein